MEGGDVTSKSLGNRERSMGITSILVPDLWVSQWQRKGWNSNKHQPGFQALQSLALLFLGLSQGIPLLSLLWEKGSIMEPYGEEPVSGAQWAPGLLLLQSQRL